MCSTDRVPEGPPDRAPQRPLEELETQIRELAAHLAAATCRWLLLVAEFDERRGWADWGAKSCAQWLCWRCSIGQVTAREHVRVARRLQELPLVREAFATGELTYCKVRAISRVATEQTEPQLVEIARHATAAQVEKLARLYGGVVAATTEAAQELHEQRSLTWSRNDDGSLAIRARLSPDDGALVLAALKAAEAESAPSEGASAEARVIGDTAAARRADALVWLARSSLAEARTSTADGEPCQVVVHVDIQSLAQDRAQERCEIADGPAIAPETLRRLACDGSVIRIIEREGRPLSVGRRKRAVHHHRLVHEGGFCVERSGKRGVRFRRPDGRWIPEANKSQSPRGPGLEPEHRAQGLVIDAETCKPRSLGDRLDYGIAVEGLCDRASWPPEERFWGTSFSGP